ncbi:MAG: M23 family metallopeptidase [Limisphaerales bacterium]
MNDDELKNLWQQQPVSAPTVSAAQLVSAMQTKMSDFRRKLLARDARELLGCVFILVIFGVFFANAETRMARFGDFIVMASAIFIGWRIIHARRTTPPAKPDASTVEALRAELHSVRTQSQLLRSVLWWYLLPIGSGVLISVWGDNNETPFQITFTLTIIFTYAFIYWVNQRARTKYLVPAQAQLEALVHAAETGEPLDSQFIKSQSIIPPQPTAAEIKRRTVLIYTGETLLVLILLGIGYWGYVSDLFFNTVFLLLFMATFVVPAIFLARAVLGKIYFGLLTKPLSRESLRYWLASLPCLAFFASCGYLLSVAIVPCQFPNHSAGYMKTFTWSMAALQLVLALMPARRISIPFTALYSIGTAFMVWHFVQIATPAPGEKIVLDSPMKGVMCVVQGGNDRLINHHYSLEPQRYALDIFKVAENVQQVRDWKIMNEDAGFGQTVYSPCSGRVAYVESDNQDNETGKTDIGRVTGNYISIEVAKDRYVSVANLKQDSTTVKVGDTVKSGDPIAQCGNSGDTSGPHIHIQVQSTPEFNYESETFPIAFHHVLRGDRELENIQAKRNDLLLNIGK